MRSTTYNENALFTENKVYELYNLDNEYKGLICGGPIVEKSSTPPGWIFSEIAYLK